MKWGKQRVTMQRDFARQYRLGLSCTVIARNLGIGRRTAQEWVWELGFLPRPVGRPRKTG
jgi:transposase-like protein